MPKKPKINKRLDNLFKDVQPEEHARGKPVKPKVQKETPLPVDPPVVPSSAPAASKPAESIQAASTPVKTTRRQTGILALPPEFIAPASSDTKSAYTTTIQLGEEEWATLRMVDENQTRSYSTDEQLLIQQVSDQLSLALENARLFQETQERSKELSILNDMSLALNKAININEINLVILEHASLLLNTDNFFVAIYDADNEKIHFPLFVANNKVVDAPSRKLGSGLTDYIIKQNKGLLLNGDIIGKAKAYGIDVVTVVDNEVAVSWVGVPISQENNIIGVISAQSVTTPNLYTKREFELLSTIANQTSIVLQRTRLFQQTERRTNEVGMLAEIATDITASKDVNQILPGIVKRIHDLLNARDVAIHFEIPGTQEYKATVVHGQYEDEITALTLKSGVGVIGNIIKNGVAEIVNEPENDKRSIIIPGTPVEEVEREVFMCAPIFQNGRAIGSLTAWRLRINNLFTKSELNFLTNASQQISLALESTRLFQETQQRAQELTIVNKVVTSVSSSLDLQSTLQSVADNLVELLSAHNVGIALINNERTHLVLTAEAVPTFEKSNDIGLLIPIEGNPATEEVIRTGKPVFINDVATNPLALPIKDILEQRGTKNLLILPLLSNEEVIGTIGVAFYDANRTITPNEVRTLETIVLQTSTAIQKSSLFERIDVSEKNLRTLFNAMEDVVLVINNEGRYIQIAPTNPSLLIRTPEAMLGRTFHELLPSKIADSFLQKVLEALNSESKVQFEYQLPIAGQLFWFLATLSKLDESSVFWVARDITERKLAEEGIRRRNEYLAVSAEIGKLVTSILDLNTIFARTVSLITDRFNFYHAAIFIVEETGFNAVMKEATGEVGAELKKLEHSLPLNDKSIVGSVASSGNVLVVNNVLEHSLHKVNELLPDTRAEAAIPLRVGSRVIGVIDIQAKEEDAFNEDEISVLQTLSDQVAVAIDNARSFELSQQAVMEMREADRLKSQFLANMSHELRTPLNSIIGFSRVILKGIDGPVTDLMQQDLTAIYNSGQHLLGLINDILDSAKIEAGKMELAFDEVNIADLVHSVLSTMSGLIKDKPIEMRQIIDPVLPTVRADAIRVRQVMINLLSNAAKFTEEGAITVSVAPIRAEDGRRQIRVSVTDTGPGISEKDQEKLFQAFSQVDASPTRKSGGTGLGLSICKQLINMHGGDIWVESAEGAGSTFHFTLPPYHKENESDQEGSKVIMTIDDDPQVIGLYERYLHPQGYQVAPLTDPKRAVEFAQRVKPFAITLDIMMPGVDGWTVLDALKSNAETRNIPVIICSIVEDVERGFSLGASDYLVKPILEEELVNSLDRLNSDGSIREVLVVDDNPNDLRLIGKMLTDDGRYKPILAEGGLNGWAVISSETPPHAVILDLFMPEMDGFQILEQMQSDRKLRDIPAIVISGMDVTPEQKNRLKEFGQRLLTKGSFNDKELLTSLQRSLDRLQAKK